MMLSRQLRRAELTYSVGQGRSIALKDSPEFVNLFEKS